ncbi:MAG: N-formylglutamate deformylase [Proteobacteria bacterium]|nr:N-formylglutamate deformylase [Pseudomonadota bacterium]
MSECFSFHEGDSPLLISVPHDGRNIPEDIARQMTSTGLSIPDTDWHVAQLYEFCDELNASVIVAINSRYVVDLNRSATDEALYEGKVSTGLCPAKTFNGEDIYRDGGAVSDAEQKRRVAAYWQPYHEQLEGRLQQLQERFGYALLWDAHSIPSHVPSLFPGELPVLNIGTNNGSSCPECVRDAVAAVATSSSYSTVTDGRFRGGFITRNYGSPEKNQYAIQLELAQRCYMDEDSCTYNGPSAAQLTQTLRAMLLTFMEISKPRQIAGK